MRLLIRLLLVLVVAAFWCAPAHAQETFEARESFRLAVITGFTRAATTVTLVAEVSAKVVELTADVGDAVGEDGVVALLDDTFIRLDVEANAAAQARLRSSVEYLEKEAARYRELVSGESAAQATLDSLENELVQARMSLQELRVAERRLGEQLARHTVRAEPGYLVMERLVEAGEWVATGQPLARVGDFSSLSVPFALSPEEFQWLESHADALRLRAASPDGEVAVPATLWRVSPAFDAETRKINAELLIEADRVDGIEPRGGLRMELDMEVPDGSSTVLVAEECLARRYDEYWLERLSGEEVRVVRLGPGPEGLVRVSSDEIAPGQRFVMQSEAAD